MFLPEKNDYCSTTNLLLQYFLVIILITYKLHCLIVMIHLAISQAIIARESQAIIACKNYNRLTVAHATLGNFARDIARESLLKTSAKISFA